MERVFLVFKGLVLKGAEIKGYFLIFSLLLLFVGKLPASAYAEITSLPGFTSGDKNGKSLDQVTWNPSPTYADLDGDGSMEVIAATGDGYLFVFGNDGELRWKESLPSASCAAANSTNKVHSSPSVGFFGGVSKIIIGYGSIGTSACGGGIVIFDGISGVRMKHHKALKLLKKLKLPGSSLSGVYSTPAIDDTDGDGLMEFAFGSFDRNIYLFREKLNGKLAIDFGLHAADTVWSSPAFFDADGDGIKEMFIGTDISANKFLQPPTTNGGYVYSIKTTPPVDSNGKKIKKFGFRDSKIVNWQTTSDQVVFSSPVLADVLSNSGTELIIQTGCFFKNSKGTYTGNNIKILNSKTGKVLRTIEIERCSQSQPAIGDIDGDGKLDIVVSVNGSDSPGQIEAYDPDTGSKKWSTEVSIKDVGFASPVIADLDQNGSPEIIASVGSKVIIFAGDTGTVLHELSAGGTANATPAVGDLNNDGSLELIFVGGKKLFVMTGFEGELGSTATEQPPGKIYTGMFRYNAARTGVYTE